MKVSQEESAQNLPRIVSRHQYLETVSFWVACNHGFEDPQIDTHLQLRWMKLLRPSPLS
jgi:hypothetical protein